MKKEMTVYVCDNCDERVDKDFITIDGKVIFPLFTMSGEYHFCNYTCMEKFLRRQEMDNEQINEH